MAAPTMGEPVATHSSHGSLDHPDLLRPKRNQEPQPSTLCPALSATLVDEVFRIGNVEISHITIVGIIRQAEKAPTSIVYKIDDMIAPPMDVCQWVDTEHTSGENTVVPPETYAKVAGHLRSFQNKKSPVAFKIMPPVDMNEFTTRILEVTNAHMIVSKANSQPSVGRAPISNLGMSEAGNFGGNSFMSANGLTVAQNQVLNLIKAYSGLEGLNFQDLKNQLKHISVSSIKQAVAFLSIEGPIYSTVDDDHFKSTDAE
uniref:replication protein A 32 kDa subunit-like n=1 Tax=Callithrix jacchus TaxID=9483 RepID=UPI00159E027C|nr:replication protein A 32 kDa subunit-like [Callithrix jacchus]